MVEIVIWYAPLEDNSVGRLFGPSYPHHLPYLHLVVCNGILRVDFRIFGGERLDDSNLALWSLSRQMKRRYWLVASTSFNRCVFYFVSLNYR